MNDHLFILRRSGNGNETSDSSLRHDFLTYLLSLMRGSDNEHGDSLPKLEVTSLQHVAYILDAFVYYLRSKTKCNAEEAKQDGLMFTNLLTNDAEARKYVDHLILMFNFLFCDFNIYHYFVLLNFNAHLPFLSSFPYYVLYMFHCAVEPLSGCIPLLAYISLFFYLFYYASTILDVSLISFDTECLLQDFTLLKDTPMHALGLPIC